MVASMHRKSLSRKKGMASDFVDTARATLYVTLRNTVRTLQKGGDTMANNKLRRQNGIVAGVCGGLGAFYGISPFWFRLLFLILLLPGGLPGLVPYIILWLVIPRKRHGE
jgi:phage shock protein C